MYARSPFTQDEFNERAMSLDSTCSYYCPECKETIYFVGSWGNVHIPVFFNCPHCNEVIEAQKGHYRSVKKNLEAGLIVHV